MGKWKSYTDFSFSNNKMDNNYGISNPSFELFLKIIAEFKDIDYAVIFGSRAKGNYKKGSDVDIAIYGENLQKVTAINLNAKLNESAPIPYFIDVVDPQYIENQDLINHIDRVGIIFYKKMAVA